MHRLEVVVDIEIWKDIPGWNGVYRASSFGNIKSVNRATSFRRSSRKVKGKILKPVLGKDGYPMVHLYKNGHYKSVRIHRLVLMTYISNPQGLPQINHKNGIKSDNHVTNLEWVTAQENIKHSWANGFSKISNKLKNVHAQRLRKLKYEDAMNVRKEYKNGETLKQLAVKYGLAISGIHKIVRNISYAVSSFI